MRNKLCLRTDFLVIVALWVAPGCGDPSQSAPDFHVALIRGPIDLDALADAQSSHDGAAAATEQLARDLGDFGHEIYLRSSLLSGDPANLLALDRWDDPAGADQLYGDPAFQSALGAVFVAAPSVELFAHQAGWKSWGDLDAADTADPRYVVLLRGRLASPEWPDSQAAHDAVAAAAEEGANRLGDVGHHSFVALADPREYLAIDVWSNADNIETLYTDPEFAAGFAGVFDGPPRIEVYESTGWHQW